MGNPISYLGAELIWDGKQLAAHRTFSSGGRERLTSYAYNEDGLRTQKTDNGTITDYYYNGSVLIGMKSGNITQRFSYDAQGKVVAVDYSENGGSSYTTYYYLRNAQGDIVKLIDNGGDTKVEYTYDSWGKVLAVTGTLATTLGEDQPFRYRGYVYDTETQLYYLQSRYYDPSTCRFISSDVYLSTGQGVLGHNSYAYCNNNPVNLADDEGQEPYFLTLAELREIHNMVRDLVALQTAGTIVPRISIEHYITSGIRRGYIDVYCAADNTYYEIKPEKTYCERYGIIEKQLNKYKAIFEAIDSNMKPGVDVTINGEFKYKDKCTVTFDYVEPGLIIYKCTPMPKKKSAPYRKIPSNSTISHLESMFFMIGFGLSALGAIGSNGRLWGQEIVSLFR